MKRFAVLLLINLLGHKAKAQIAMPRTDIVSLYGTPIKKGVTNNNINFITYRINNESKVIGKYITDQIFYFKRFDDGLELCFKYVMLEPLSEINSWVKSLKEKYVSIGPMKWKNYEKNESWTVVSIEGKCVVTVEFDNSDY